MTNQPKDVYTFKVCDKNYFESMTMHCPACDDTYTHLESIGTDFNSNDDKFTVRVQQHKGLTYFEISGNVIYRDWDGENWIDSPR